MSITPERPIISGDWQKLYTPEKHGRYVNDHTIIKAHDGRWHLFGITSLESGPASEKERYFTHGVGDSLSDGKPWEENGIICDNGVRAWAPGVIAHQGRYFLFYGPSPMRLATSLELKHWMEHTPYLHNDPWDSNHRDHMVIKIEPGYWLMYVTGINDQMYGVISVFESRDLRNWTFIRYALETADGAPLNPAWGATESPYVVKRGDWYYLFITYTDCSMDNYHNTLVFRSTDPTDFGTYTGDNHDDVVIAILHAHAPEILEEDGQWYITSCGWRGFNTVTEGGVGIAPLSWETD